MKYSDEQVIADVHEVFASEEAKEKGERPVCLSFQNPYSLHVVNETEGGYNITFKKWNPFSDDTGFNVGFDLVGTINNETLSDTENVEKIVAPFGVRGLPFGFSSRGHRFIEVK